MGKKKSPQDTAQDSAGIFYQHVITNTPYHGPLFNLPNGSGANVRYYPGSILLVPSTDKVPTHANTQQLNETLGMGATLSGIMSFVTTSAGVTQANELFYIDEAGKIVKKTAQIPRKVFEEASDIGKLGKGFGTALSWVSVGFMMGQAATEGVNINTGTDMVICAIGFIPGVGWVLAGVYTVANVGVTIATGKTIPENIYDPLFDLYVRFCNELKAKLFGWYNIPFTFR